MKTVRRILKWIDKYADDAVEIMAYTSIVMMVVFFGGCCIIGMIKLWAWMW